MSLISVSAPNYSSKIDQLFKLATDLGFTEQDFAELALAAADQSGASVNEQERIARALGLRPFPQRKQ